MEMRLPIPRYKSGIALYSLYSDNNQQDFYRVGQVELETEISSSILVSSEMEEESI